MTNILSLFNLGNPITVVSYILPGNGNEFWITFLTTLHLTTWAIKRCPCHFHFYRAMLAQSAVMRQ